MLTNLDAASALCGEDGVEESEKTSVLMELRLDCTEGLVLTKSGEHGHEGIALLSNSSLTMLMGGVLIVFPEIGRWVAVELKNEKRDRISTFDGTKAAEYRHEK